TVGLGEEPLWHPHEAARFAGRAGMPDRFIGFHIAYNALYEFHNGPGRKVFADPRLEVIGPKQYERYLNLQDRIIRAKPGWAAELDQIGRRAIMVEHTGHAPIGASLLTSGDWRCAWFDPMAAVFLHRDSIATAQVEPVDFLARHFRPDPAVEPGGVPAL